MCLHFVCNLTRYARIFLTMQNQSMPKRQRARKKKTVVAREAGFSIRTFRDGFIVQVRRKGFKEKPRTFATLEAARLYCQQLAANQTNEGLAGFDLDAEQRLDARKAIAALGGRANLFAAAQAWLRLNPAADALTVAQLFEQHLDDLQKRNRRPDTLRERNQRLNRFAVDYGNHAATAIMPRDVEQWLTLRLPEKSFNPFRVSLSAAFSFALKNGIVPVNPVAAIAPKTVEHGEPVFWPVETVAKIMHAAADLDAKRAAMRAALEETPAQPWPPLTPYLALSAFAGLRPDESRRLDWSNLNLDEALIRIPAAASKVRRARLVPMPENLVRWLLPYRKTTGAISPSAITIKRGRKSVLKAAGVKDWPQDVLRHSFATHWMAAHAHEGKLAEMMGNSPAMIQRHYKGLATAKEGAKYFKIEPPAAGNVIQLRQAVA